MGVDGIDKADIFDEFFDDDKPKLTNYEKIKNMTIDEMAEYLCDEVMGECFTCPFQDECKDRPQGFKEWLESEAEE